MNETGGEKKHPPTENRLRELRRDGVWYASRELTAAALLAVLALLWSVDLPGMSARALDLALLAWQPKSLSSPDPLHVCQETARQTGLTALLMIAIVMGSMFIIAALVRFLQVRAIFSVKPLWRIGNLNPASGFKRIFFTAETYQHAAIGLLKAGLMLGLVAVSLWRSLHDLIFSVRIGPIATVKVFQQVFAAFLWQAAGLYLLFGAADWLIQKTSFVKRNRMTDEELREDTKQTEGNPQTKMRHRTLRRLELIRALRSHRST